MKIRPNLVALFTLLLLVSFASAQDRIVVHMPGETRENLVTPRAIAAAKGHHWVDEEVLAWPDGAPTLAGYFVELDGYRCPITQINSEALVFVVPETVREGVQRTLWIQGPRFVRFIDVRVERFWPRLNEQDGVAVAFAGLFPIAYLGEPIPVSPTGFNYVSLLVTGFLTGRPAEFGPKLFLEHPSERHEISAEVYDVPGFPGTERLTFWAPPCANGEYALHVAYAGYMTNPVKVRFVSSCPPIQIERPARITRPRSLPR